MNEPPREVLDYLATLTDAELTAVTRMARAAPAPQLTRDDLKTMSAEAIVKAKSEGRLNGILGIDGNMVTR